MKRKILKANVTRLALCKRGLNTLQTLYKAADGARFSALVKAAGDFDERGELLFVAAVPGMEFADGDFYGSADALRASAHAFLRNGAELDLEHDGKVLSTDDAFVAESFVIQKGDPRFAGWQNYDGESVDVTGGWGGIIQIESPALRKAYRAGDWDGVSLFAPAAQLELVKSDTNESELVRAIRKAIGAPCNTNPAEDDDVKPEEITAAVTAGMKPVLEMLAKALPQPKDGADEKGKPAADDAPEFDGDPTDADDLAKHAAALEAHALRKSGDLKDPKKVAALLAKARAAKVDPKTEREELRKTNAALAEALDAKDAADKRIADLEKGSNQNAGGGDTNSGASDDSDEPAHPFVERKLVKSANPQGLMDAARKAADALNRRRHPRQYAGK